MALQEFTMKVVTFQAKFGHAGHPFNIWRKCQWLKTFVHITWLDILPRRLALVLGNFSTLLWLDGRVVLASDFNWFYSWIKAWPMLSCWVNKWFLQLNRKLWVCCSSSQEDSKSSWSLKPCVQEHHLYKSNCHWLIQPSHIMDLWPY